MQNAHWAIIGGLLAIAAAAVIMRAMSRARKNEAVLNGIRRDLRLIDWSNGGTIGAVDQVVGKLTELFEQELSWYRSRRVMASVAKGLRWAAWLIGTAGAVCPLIAPIVAGDDAATTATVIILGGEWPLVSTGYLLLAIAASCLACNRFLGLTEGHIRYATAQLELEAKLDELTFAWLSLKARAQTQTNGHLDLDAVDAILKAGYVSLHRIVLDETKQWATQTEAQQAAHAAKIGG